MSDYGCDGLAAVRFSLPVIDAMLHAAFGLASGSAPDLRWRIKQMQRHDWPDTTVTDRELRKGYSPRQALRILVASALLDAGYGPTQAIKLARENENATLAIMATGLAVGGRGERLFAVHRPGTVGPGSVRLSEPTPLVILPVAASELTLMKENGCGRALVVLDLAGMAGRAVDVLGAGSADALDRLEALVAEGAHATARGNGFVASDHPTGDRYLSPRRRKNA